MKLRIVYNKSYDKYQIQQKSWWIWKDVGYYKFSGADYAWLIPRYESVEKAEQAGHIFCTKEHEKANEKKRREKIPFVHKILEC